ncbi:MAG TPA: hypothetical protein VGA75_05350 [Paracoccaceae bacterium]
MTISRNFLLIGSVYLLVGISLGFYMGASEDHTLSPVHAHINLLGFTLMSIFGLAYRVFPELAGSALATTHFWLHQIGALVLLVALFLEMSGQVAEASLGPVVPVAIVTVLLGMLTFAWNVFRNAR